MEGVSVVVPNAVDADETEVVPVWGCLDIA